MNASGFVKYAAALVALAVCSACAGGSAGAPSNATPAEGTSVNGRPMTTALPYPRVPPTYATLLPERHTKAKTFEYVINYYSTYASIFDYPKSDNQVGTINNVGGQGCTNTLYGYGKKIIWIVAGQDQITEYQVPKKPLKTLDSPYYFPSSCAMDAAGDLAVGILSNGDVVIFKNASGSGTTYTTPLGGEYFDGYDPQGDLFADGFTYSGNVALVELPSGGSSFETITLSNSIQFPGSVQWDGKYLTVLDQRDSNIYQYTISGTKATLEGTVSLSGAGDCAQTWIVTGAVFCGDYDGGGEVFKYPTGGKAIAAFSGNFDSPLGVTAAKK